MNQKPHSESEFLTPMTKGIPLWIWSTQFNSSATEIVNERHSPEIETSNHILTSPVQKRVNSPDINRTKGFGNFLQVLFKNIADFAIMFHKCTYWKNRVLSYIFSLLKHFWEFNKPMLWLFCVALAILGDWFNSSRYVEDLLSGRYTLMEFLVAVNFLLHFLIVDSQAACGRCQNSFSAYLQCKQTVFLLFESYA